MRILSLLAALMMFLPPSPGAAAMGALAAPTSCPTPAEFTTATTPLGHLAAAVKARQKLHILAVGSATMRAPGRAPAGTGFAQRMTDALHRAWPGSEISIDIEGHKGITAAEQLALIRAALARGGYQLVIWQTGTVDALRGTAPAEFAATLAAGAESAGAARADLVLVDQQFTRMLEERANLAPYQQALHATASAPGRLLFRRYDLMRQWAEGGVIDLEHATPGTRLSLAESLHRCLGHALAALVIDAVARAS